MTREQAADLVYRFAPGTPCRTQASNWVTVFSELGMLKLDEPKSANQKARDAALAEHEDMTRFEMCLGIIERAGLKIVEK